MILIALTGCLVIALALNHVVHGFGCWGLQPGGPTSAFIYDLQILTAILGIGWLSIAITRRTVPVRRARLLAIGLFASVSVVMFWTTGWTAHTSIHHQGPENLLAFFPVVLTALATGTYSWWNKLKTSRIAVGGNGIGFDQEETGNPYQSPRT